jgi:hypothetical protein
MNKLALLAAAALALGSFTTTSSAQEPKQRGGEDFRNRMVENLRTLLDVKNEDEWKLLYARLEKVREARDEVRAVSGDFRLLFNIGRTGEQGGAAPGGDRGGRGPGGFGGGTPNPDSEALSKAITTKAPTDELKQRMARVREARKAAEAKHEKLAEELRQLLTVRQEAALVAVGMLK